MRHVAIRSNRLRRTSFDDPSRLHGPFPILCRILYQTISLEQDWQNRGLDTLRTSPFLYLSSIPHREDRFHLHLA
jgi:hypothetical protein